MLTVPIPTDDALLSEMLKKSFGWYWPPYDFRLDLYNLPPINLPIPVINYFRQLEPDAQQELVRFKEELKNAQNIEEMEEIYRATRTIRLIFVESINRIYLREDIDVSSPQFWDDNNLSELYWLKLMKWMMMNKKYNSSSCLAKGKGKCRQKEDYPVFINFIPCDPLQSNRPIPTNPHVQVQTMKILNMNDQEQNFQTVGFQDTTYNNYRHHDICFKRKNPFPNIMISHHIDRIGCMWIEKSSEDDDSQDDPRKKNYRVLFQKTSSDLDLGLFLWPQFNVKKIPSFFLENQSTYLPDTPKIPIYQNQIVELCDQDRLILFTTQFRSHRVFINLQISIEFRWASEFIPSKESFDFQQDDPDVNKIEDHQETFEWIDNIFQWPNPSERYSHYLKEPKSYPMFYPILDMQKKPEAPNSTTTGKEEQAESLDAQDDKISAQSKHEQEHPDETVTHQIAGGPESSKEITDSQVKNGPESTEKTRFTSRNDSLSAFEESRLNVTRQKNDNDSMFKLAQTPKNNSSHLLNGSGPDNAKTQNLSQSPPILYSPMLPGSPSLTTESDVDADQGQTVTRRNAERTPENQRDISKYQPELGIPEKKKKKIKR